MPNYDQPEEMSISPETGNNNEDMELIFTKLKELDEKGALTEDDVKWFNDTDISSAFCSLEKLLYTGKEEEEEDDGSERLNTSKLLRRSVTEKVRGWEKDNLE